MKAQKLPAAELLSSFRKPIQALLYVACVLQGAQFTHLARVSVELFPARQQAAVK
ncbi:MAG: hypothetical protein GY742_19425 [Hyphomicrobiales bacterium]|nr:hypothetical protein [Hyphomicrobiales bacterium]